MKMKALLAFCVVSFFISTTLGSFAQTTIMSDTFNSSSAANKPTGWQVQVDGATVTTPSSGLTTNSYLSSSLANYQTVPPISWYPDYGGLVLTLGAQGSPVSGGTRRYVSPAYAVPAGTTRALATVSVRAVNIAAEDVSISLLESDASGNTSWVQGGVNFSNPSDLSDFVRIVPETNWRTYTKLASMKSTTTKVYVEIVVKNNANTTGVIYLDDVSVVTNTSTNYLIEAYSGSQGQVFPGTTGNVKIYPYDPNPAEAVTINVVDETGTAVNPQPTVTFANGFYTVALARQQYYAIQVNGTSANGAFSSTFTSAVINPAAPVASSPFGMFNVQTTNQMGYSAGSNWNRFFIWEQVISQNADQSFSSGTSLSAEGSPAPADFVFLPATQKKEACMLGVPEFMANVPSGATFSESKFYPPTNWSQFELLVEYIVENLPASVQDLEVINEPEYNWGGSATTKYADINMYFQTVHNAVAAVRAQGLLPNPNLKIIGPSFAHFYSPTYNEGQVALQNALFAGGQFGGDTGLLTYVDEISMHGYLNASGLQEPEAQFYDRIYQWENYERNTAHAPGLTTDGTITGPLKPIHMTEYGWELGTSAGEVTEPTRANYTSRAMIISHAFRYSGIGGGIPFNSILSFCLRYVTGGVWEPWSTTNLDYTPTPTYVAYSTTAKALGGMNQAGPYLNYVPTLPTGGGTDYQCATFQNSSTQFSETCLWSSSTTGATLKVHMPFSASYFGAVDAMGRSVTIPTNGLLTLSNSPVFVQAWNFFAPTVTSTFTVAHSTTIPSFTYADILCPSTFTIQGATPNFTIKTPATAGTYSIMAKVGSTWGWYKVVVN